MGEVVVEVESLTKHYPPNIAAVDGVSFSIEKGKVFSCKVATCAYRKGVRLCFECAEFPCETSRSGPIDYGYCTFISGRSA